MTEMEAVLKDKKHVLKTLPTAECDGRYMRPLIRLGIVWMNKKGVYALTAKGRAALKKLAA